MTFRARPCIVTPRRMRTPIAQIFAASGGTHTPVAPGFEYCRSATFNAAVPIARGEVIVAHDNDMLVPERYAAEVLARAREGWHFIDLKRFIFYLSEADSRAIFDGAPLRNDHITKIVQNLKGGSIAATRDAYIAIGGFDEDFVGWGGEDLEFWERARAYGCPSKSKRTAPSGPPSTSKVTVLSSLSTSS